MTAKVRPFGELFAVGTRNGLMRPKAVRGTGVKMVNMGELFAYPRLRNTPMDRVLLDGVEPNKSVLESGDLLFARQSLVLEGAGKCSIFLEDDEAVTFESHITRVRLDPQKADPRFYFYYFQSHHGRAAIKSIVEQGAGASGIRGGDLKELGVRWRPLSEQCDIADRLGALDDKIEQNRRTAQALERLAQAIFRAWFVDFEPVKAKAAGATDFPSMPQAVFGSLPTRFVDSAVGRVPDRWSISAVGSCSSYLSRGITPRYVDDGVLVLNQKCIRDFAINYEKARRHDSSARRIDGREIKVGDVLINSTGVGTLGRLAQVLHLPEAAVVDTHVTVVRPAPEISPSYFGQAFISMQPHIESLGEGSTGQTELSRRKVSELPLLIPTPELMDAYQNSAAPLLDFLLQTRLENIRLADLRDYLLPQLLSGQVQVVDS